MIRTSEDLAIGSFEGSEIVYDETMKGKERLRAIDRSTPAMSRGLPMIPMRETVMVRLLRGAVVGMGQCFERMFARMGMSEHAFHVLCLLLSEEDGTCSPSELSELVGASRANMTRILDELSGLGFIVRESDLRDARRTVVHITDTGRAAVLAAANQVVDPLRQAFAGLSRDEFDTLDALLRKAIESFDTSLSAPR